MIKAGVIGFPVKHSKSPLIHGYWLERYKIEGSYKAIEISESNFENEIKELFDDGYSGFNVTIPYKLKIMDICDQIDKNANSIGAVNTVVKLDNGKIEGRNTDSFGFIQNIKENASDYEFKASNAMLLGAGGAARACLYGLLDEKLNKIYLTNRTREKAINLANDMKQYGNIEVVEWDDKESYLSDISLLVNSTSLGMTGKSDLEIDLSNLPQGAIVNDIVYAPLYTDLLMQAKENNNIAVTGIGMLLHQARPGFEAWFGQKPKVTKELENKLI